MGTQFDDLCKSLAVSMSRRDAAKLAIKSLLTAALATLLPAAASALHRLKAKPGNYSCGDGFFTCCPSNFVCVDDKAIPNLKGCCPEFIADGKRVSILCGGVCCVSGEECDVVHKQCVKKKGGN